jgi:hypothetical protein
MRRIVGRLWRQVAVVVLLIGTDVAITLPIIGATYRPFSWTTLTPDGVTTLYPARPDVGFYGVGKTRFSTQTDTNAPIASGGTSFVFSALVELSPSGAVDGASVALPNGSVHALANPTSTWFSLELGFVSQEQLDAACATGVYTLVIEAVHDGTRSVRLDLPAAAYPDAPRIANWEDLQAADAGAETVVRWDPLSGLTTNDVVILRVFDSALSPVWASDPLGETNWAVLPAFTLESGRVYVGQLSNTRLVANDRASYPGYPVAHGHVFYSHLNRFALATVSDLWADAVDAGGGWKYLPWFGYFSDRWERWIYHLQHGWLYPLGASDASLWLYPFPDNGLGWHWTSRAIYPWIYSYEGGTWMYYLRDSVGPRWFFNWSTQQWQTQ